MQSGEVSHKRVHYCDDDDGDDDDNDSDDDDDDDHNDDDDVLTTLQVPLWITFNEAFVVSWLGHGIGIFAPGINDPGVGVYKVAHNIVRSHTKAYHTYDQHFKHFYHGMWALSSLRVVGGSIIRLFYPSCSVLTVSSSC